MTERRYSYPVWRTRIAQVMLLCITALGVPIIAFGEGPVGFSIIFAAALGAIAWWAVFRLPKRRARETAQGVHTWDLGFPISRVLKWSDIERFEVSAFPGKQKLVDAVMQDGRCMSIMGLDAGATTSWDGPQPGSTDDIVGELNQRLVLWRQELGLPGPETAEGRRTAGRYATD